MVHPKADVVELIKQYCIEYGDFTLASGAKSKYYIDLRRLTMFPEGVHKIGSAFYRMLPFLKFSRLGGPATGANAIVASILGAYGEAERIKIKGFYVLPEAKTHGMGKQINGFDVMGHDCWLVDDVMTSGGSIVKCVSAVRQAGGRVAGVACILDRLAGGREVMASMNLKYFSLCTIDDLGLTL